MNLLPGRQLRRRYKRYASKVVRVGEALRNTVSLLQMAVEIVKDASG